MPATDRSHYDYSYEVRSRRVRAVAYAERSTTCWRCGKTLDVIRAENPGRRIEWQAGHTIDADRFAPLLAECSLCNSRAGQALTMGKRRTSGGTGRF